MPGVRDSPEAAALRMGVLGAARIAPGALIKPARAVPGVEIVAVAARDVARAQRFAHRYGVARVHRSYQELLADPEIDAVYNPLPNALHCEWSVRALEAGKHVLCEKPLASNAAEARRMADAARASERLLFEAFHWRYHPLAERMRAVIASGELGRVRRIEAWLCIPMWIPGDIRWRYDLAGGALMDAGCYAVSMLRHLADAEPQVTHARAALASPGVDRWMEAELRFEDGRSGWLRASMFSWRMLSIGARVTGDAGSLSVFNPIAPHIYHRLRVRRASGARSERVPGEASYTHQLRAFEAAVRGGERPPTDGEDGVANMAVIDAIYERAGLPLRGA